MAFVVAATIFGCLSANVLFGPRVSLAMARDGLFFRSFSTVHARYRVPSRAIVGQAVWSSLLCLSGQFPALIEYVVFALVLFFAASGLAVFVLRAKRPGLVRPYKAWGYPILPGLFVAINLAVFINRIISQTEESLAGIIILALGWPAYLYWKSKARPASPQSSP